VVNLRRVSESIGNFDNANGITVNYSVSLMTRDLQSYSHLRSDRSGSKYIEGCLSYFVQFSYMKLIIRGIH